MAGTSLDGVQHTTEFSKAGDEHVCTVHVTMPDKSVQKFEATCATKHAARLIAVFKASFAVKCARELEESAPLQEQEASAPSEQGADASGDSSPKSLDVESRDIEPRNEVSTMLVDTHLDDYSSSAEEDDDELRVGRRRNTLHAPIAFVPAPNTSVKHVENERNDAPRNYIDRKSSVERSLLGDAESQHVKEVLCAVPSRERSRETSDVDEGEWIENVAKRVGKEKVDRPRLTPRKRKDPPSQSEPASVGHAASQSRKDPAVSQRRAKHLRSEPISDRKRGTRAGTSWKRGSHRTPIKGSNLPSHAGNGSNRKEESVGKHGSTELQSGESPEHNQPPPQRRTLHNAELPVTSGSYNHDSRIPRLPKQELKGNEAILDATQSNGYGYASMYQQQPLPHGHVPHVPHPGHIHNSAAPFGAQPMYPGAAPHHLGYASHYPAPQVSHHPPHMGAAYPPPAAPYATPPPGQPLTSNYTPQQGFPPPAMPHGMGAYPYQHPLPNGTNPYYHHPQEAYHARPIHETQKVQREAEIRATAAQVAAKMAAEAAAKDAARNAKSDFEADQKAKRAHQDKGGTQGRSKKSAKERESFVPNSSGSRTVQQGAAPTQQIGENDISVDSIPADDGDQEDYVSTLNRMAQKGTPCTNLSTPKYVQVRGENGARSGQQCTMSVRFAPDPEKEGVLISKTVVASKKRKAKQLAAKEILAEIDKRTQSQPQPSDEADGSKEKEAKVSGQKKTNGITTAVAALHRLYTLNVLCGPPCFKPEEPAGGSDRGLWKSVVLLEVKDFGKRSYEAIASSKKSAKQLCALKAFEALKEMKVPEVESFTNISKDGKEPESNKPSDEEDATPIKPIVDMSDDDKDSNSSVDAELAQHDDRLMLPKDYKLVFPENKSECERWFKDNCKSGASFGLFVDSPRARAVFMTSPYQMLPNATKDGKVQQPRFLCLSTATSGIVIRFPEFVEEGPDSECADDSNPSLPEVVVSILEDPKIKKCGIAVEDGIAVLEHEEDFRAQAVGDIALTSLAITGLDTLNGNGPLASLPELTKLWLKKEPGKISVKGAWREKSDIPAKLPTEGGKEIMVGVLASFACFCISQQMSQAARQKRTRTHGVAVAFLQLSEQIMSTAPA